MTYLTLGQRYEILDRFCSLVSSDCAGRSELERFRRFIHEHEDELMGFEPDRLFQCLEEDYRVLNDDGEATGETYPGQYLDEDEVWTLCQSNLYELCDEVTKGRNERYQRVVAIYMLCERMPDLIEEWE